VKIGITAGNTIKKRLVGLQTSHWLELQVFYESPSIPNVNKVEQELHQRFSQYNIRGEWFDIPQEKIKKLVKELQKKFSTP
jgi:hypothetical protein